MQLSSWQRTTLRSVLAVGATFGKPFRTEGQTMDPAMSALVRYIRKFPVSRADRLPMLRARYAAAPALTGLPRDPAVKVTPLRAGARPGRLYDPPGGSTATMLFFHGGGFIMGGLDSHDALCRRLAILAGIRVVAVEYRLSPEHKFPAAHDDAAEAWRWAQATLPGPLLVGGDSAGGNLAAGLALTGRPVLQMLIYPAVDLLHQDGLYPSILQFSEGFVLTAQGMRDCASMLLPPGQDAGDPRLSPIRADLSRASPAVIVTAGFDPLRDQGAAYGAALHAAGGSATMLHEAGLVHGFADFAGVVPAARRAIDRLAATMRAALDTREERLNVAA